MKGKRLPFRYYGSRIRKCRVCGEKLHLSEKALLYDPYTDIPVGWYCLHCRTHYNFYDDVVAFGDFFYPFDVQA